MKPTSDYIKFLTGLCDGVVPSDKNSGVRPSLLGCRNPLSVT